MFLSRFLYLFFTFIIGIFENNLLAPDFDYFHTFGLNIYDYL